MKTLWLKIKWEWWFLTEPVVGRYMKDGVIDRKSYDKARADWLNREPKD